MAQTSAGGIVVKLPLLLALAFLSAVSGRSVTYYADNNATGNGSCDDAANRGRIATCVARMSAPGDTVSLASGTIVAPKVYTGPGNRISLTVHGTAAHPVTVVAETTFGVVLDGQGVNEMFITRAQHSRLIGVAVENVPPTPTGNLLNLRGPIGSVSVANGSARVTWVSGGKFPPTADVSGAAPSPVSRGIEIDGIRYQISSVTNPISLVLSSNYSGTTGTKNFAIYDARMYQYVQDVIVINASPKHNVHAIGNAYVRDTRLVRVAAAGSWRKGIESYRNMGPTIIDHCIIAYDGNQQIGPEGPISLTYDSEQTRIYNTIMAARNEWSKITYPSGRVPQFNNGCPFCYKPLDTCPGGVSGCGASTILTSHRMDQPYAAGFFMDRNSFSPGTTNSTCIGCIVLMLDEYPEAFDSTTGGKGSKFSRGVFALGIGGTKIKHTLVHVDSNEFLSTKDAYSLNACNRCPNPSSTGNEIDHSAAVGGTPNGGVFDSNWTKTNFVWQATPSTLNIYQDPLPPIGPTFCKAFDATAAYGVAKQTADPFWSVEFIGLSDAFDLRLKEEGYTAFRVVHKVWTRYGVPGASCRGPTVAAPTPNNTPPSSSSGEQTHPGRRPG